MEYNTVYFKELHNEQEYYWSKIYRAGVAVVSTITSLVVAIATTFEYSQEP